MDDTHTQAPTNSSSDAQPEVDASMQVVCFFIDHAKYAIDIMRVKEIIRPIPATQIPLAPEFVEGIVELRGAFLPVVDLRKRFGLAPREADTNSKYVIVSIGGRIVGLVVDQVADRRQIPVADFNEPPPMVVAANSRFFAGVAKSDGEILVLLDLDYLLTEGEQDLLATLGESES